jgi:hypothetical protein
MKNQMKNQKKKLLQMMMKMTRKMMRSKKFNLLKLIKKKMRKPHLTTKKMK